MKKPFVLPTSKFTGNFPTPPTYSELEPIDYFYSMFGKESLDMLKDQSNMHSVQVNPNRPMNIFDTDILQFIGIFDHFRQCTHFHNNVFYWMDGTRVQSIVLAMSRDRFLINKKVFTHGR